MREDEWKSEKIGMHLLVVSRFNGVQISVQMQMRRCDGIQEGSRYYQGFGASEDASGKVWLTSFFQVRSLILIYCFLHHCFLVSPALEICEISIIPSLLCSNLLKILTWRIFTLNQRARSHWQSLYPDWKVDEWRGDTRKMGFCSLAS